MSFNRDFAARLAVALVGGLFFLCLAWYNNIGYTLVFGCFALIALTEYFKLARRGGEKPVWALGYAIVTAFFLIAYRGLGENPSGKLQDLHIALAAVFVLLAVLKLAQMASPNPSPIIAMLLITVFGSFYIGGALSCMINLHRMYELDMTGMKSHYNYDTLMMLPFVAAWSSDTGAYLAGRLVGRDKLTRISPNKTFEGLVGAIFAGFIAIFIFGRQLQLALPVIICLGLTMPFIGIAGDLFESAIKRRFEVKDSGTFFKAHGGVLDRMDSIFFVLPATYSIIYYYYFIYMRA